MGGRPLVRGIGRSLQTLMPQVHGRPALPLLSLDVVTLVVFAACASTFAAERTVALCQSALDRHLTIESHRSRILDAGDFPYAISQAAAVA